MFIHTALLEYINCGDTSIIGPINNVQNKIDELSMINPKRSKTGFQLQFEVCRNNTALSCCKWYVILETYKEQSQGK